MPRIAALLLLLAASTPAQVAILHIQVLEGEGAIHQPGARSSRPLVVEITDETGRPIQGAAASIHLPEDGPGGNFASGLRTDVTTTDARGRATFHTFQANRTPGRFQIRIVASKEQARAGTVSFQYIAETKPKTAAIGRAGSGQAHRGRWIAIVAAIGGGAAGALLASHSGSSTAPTPTTPAVPAFSIGSPNISVGKP